MISALKLIIRLKLDLASLDFGLVREIGVGGEMVKYYIELDPEVFIRE